MAAKQPAGRITVNTIEGIGDGVRDTEKNDYILIDAESCQADAPRTYKVKGKTIKINQYNEIIKALAKKRLC